MILQHSPQHSNLSSSSDLTSNFPLAQTSDLKSNPPLTERPENFKSGFVAIIGRPSVGKSTFINKVCDKNIAITSKHPQTTRNIIKGIFTTEKYQIVFLDTPGIHLSETQYGKHLTKHAYNALQSADAIIYMLDATRAPQEEEKSIAELIQKHDSAIFLVVNKSDIASHAIYEAHIAHAEATLGEKLHATHSISSLTGANIVALLDDISTVFPVQAPYYPEEYYTDQTPEFRICEQVRAAAIEFVKDEIPHALYTEIAESSVKNTDREGNLSHLFVRVLIVVERPSQKGIVIGKEGSMIKQIRILAKKRINEIFDYNVQLELKVVVRKKWRKAIDIFSNL